MDPVTRVQDEWLALRCQAGEPNAFQDLATVVGQPLFYYAVKLTANPETARDILQETWLRAHRGIRHLKDPASVRPWLYSIVRAAAIDHIRRDTARERAEEIHSAEAERTAGESFDAEDAAEVHRALDQLEPRHREVLTLFFLEDFSHKEIAAVVGCAEGTVKSRLYYAKQEMRELLKGKYA